MAVSRATGFNIDSLVLTRKDDLAAQALLEKAVAIDPNYAQPTAITGLLEARLNLSHVRNCGRPTI